MWILTSLDNPELSYDLLVGREYTIGRRECDIIIPNDMSISRKHAVIKVTYIQQATTSSSNQNVNGTQRAGCVVVLQDLSKLGTLLRGERICNGAQKDLNNGDIMIFGTAGVSKYRIVSVPCIVTSSCLASDMKKHLKAVLRPIGGYVISDWTNDCSFVVMSQLSVTIKVVCALLCQKSVVTVEYFENLVKSIESKTKRPNPHDYLPQLAETTVNPSEVSFREEMKRKSLFENKTFVFLSNEQYKRLHTAVELGGGITLLFTTEGLAEDRLIEEGICVLACSDTELSQSSTQPCGLLGSISRFLTRNGRRLIAESELGFAVLHCSTEYFCNPLSSAADKVKSRLQAASDTNTADQSESSMPSSRRSEGAAVDRRETVSAVENRGAIAASDMVQVKQEPMSQSAALFDESFQAVANHNIENEHSLSNQRAALNETAPAGRKINSKKRELADDNDLASARNKQIRLDDMLIKSEPEFDDNLLLAAATVNTDSANAKVAATKISANAAASGETEFMNGTRTSRPTTNAVATAAVVATRSVAKRGRALDEDELDLWDVGVNQESSCTTSQAGEREKRSRSELNSNSNTATAVKVEDSEQWNDLAERRTSRRNYAVDIADIPAGFLSARVNNNNRQSLRDVKDELLPVSVVVLETRPLVVRKDVGSGGRKNQGGGNRASNIVNFKTFKKSGVLREGLPRIIGGSALSAHVRQVQQLHDDIFNFTPQAEEKEEDFDQMCWDLFRLEPQKRKK